MLFVYVNVNVTRGSITQSWMVPSPVFEANTTVNARGRRVFWLFWQIGLVGTAGPASWYCCSGDPEPARV